MSLGVKNWTDPSYLSRINKDFGPPTAGAASVTTKWVTFAAIQLFSLSTYMVTAGTSSSGAGTNTVNGTATINGQLLSLIIVSNTATAGATASLGTTTVGPFLAGGGFVSGGVGTGQIGGVNQFALNTTTGTAGQGGIPVPPQSLVYIVSGTDATAQCACSLDYQVQPGAALTI